MTEKYSLQLLPIHLVLTLGFSVACTISTSACQRTNLVFMDRRDRQLTQTEQISGRNSGELENEKSVEFDYLADVFRSMDAMESAAVPTTDPQWDLMDFSMINGLLLELESESLSASNRLEVP